jgi:hypothetical protein
MPYAMTVLTGVALLVAGSTYISIRAISTSDLTSLPVSCRQRLAWWRLKAWAVYLACGAVAVSTAALYAQAA